MAAVELSRDVPWSFYFCSCILLSLMGRSSGFCASWGWSGPLYTLRWLNRALPSCRKTIKPCKSEWVWKIVIRLYKYRHKDYYVYLTRPFGSIPRTACSMILSGILCCNWSNVSTVIPPGRPECLLYSFWFLFFPDTATFSAFTFNQIHKRSKHKLHEKKTKNKVLQQQVLFLISHTTITKAPMSTLGV